MVETSQLLPPLSPDLFARVVSYLPLRDVVQARCVCRMWQVFMDRASQVIPQIRYFQANLTMDRSLTSPMGLMGVFAYCERGRRRDLYSADLSERVLTEEMIKLLPKSVRHLNLSRCALSGCVA